MKPRGTRLGTKEKVEKARTPTQYLSTDLPRAVKFSNTFSAHAGGGSERIWCLEGPKLRWARSPQHGWATACGGIWRVKKRSAGVAVRSAVVARQCERGGASGSGERQCETAQHAACVLARSILESARRATAASMYPLGFRISAACPCRLGGPAISGCTSSPSAASSSTYGKSAAYEPPPSPAMREKPPPMLMLYNGGEMAVKLSRWAFIEAIRGAQTVALVDARSQIMTLRLLGRGGTGGPKRNMVAR